ncbi:MAG TPA: class I SAM-dependent methyltransferase [Steroidobacteraceae bacterium]|nr:class I SAM-dependent methyltransferase [Steroidobacteraceae bacterium]
MKVSLQYSVAAPEGIASRIAGYQRRRMFEHFLRSTAIKEGDSVLDVGVTADQSYEHSNYLEAWYPHKSRITAVGLDDASFLEKRYPGVKYQRADGRNLPFADATFDFVHSSAVLEHVGSRASQARFLAELWRVCRKGIFVTTPNRWFPVEFHSVLPLIHWLPPRAFRGLLRAVGHDMLAREENLNLMSSGELLKLATVAGVANCRVRGARLAGITSNLLLSAKKIT